jgi:hypothetical protein
MLADRFTGLLAGAGFAVPGPVSLTCGGGGEPSATGHGGRLVLKGIPWLRRRGREFLPLRRGDHVALGPRADALNTRGASASEAGWRTKQSARRRRAAERFGGHAAPRHDGARGGDGRLHRHGCRGRGHPVDAESTATVTQPASGTGGAPGERSRPGRHRVSRW